MVVDGTAWFGAGDSLLRGEDGSDVERTRLIEGMEHSFYAYWARPGRPLPTVHLRPI